MNVAQYEKIKECLEDKSYSDWDCLLITLVDEYNKHVNHHLIQDLLIRFLERKSEIKNSFIIDQLLGELGLYPYVSATNMSTKDKIRNSFFVTPQDENKVFHVRQAEVFQRLMNGENIILSAPTSFGKSLIIEAVVASHKHNNVVIVVPTIALIDELKKKLHSYKNHYKIITQPNQSISDRNIFVFTQERVLECSSIDNVDFFIIDEFYKLAPSQKVDERCDRLNLAFRKLYENCQHFYMLGPNINGLVSGIDSTLRCTFLQFDQYKTVATNEYYYPLTAKGKAAVVDVERDKKLFEIIRNIGQSQQTVIYCKSPQRASLIMSKLLNSGLLKLKNNSNELSSWLREVYNSDWSLAKAIEYGLAYHHAKLPRAISSLIVELFNSATVNILVCTSTLIEGVNTNAKNIIIYDDCITAQKKLDLFTFNNISGRSGRMFEHHIGNVYVFGEKPQVELPFIDFPIVTMGDNVSESLLIHVNDGLTEVNKNKVKKYLEQKILPFSLLTKHQGVDAKKLINFAESLQEKCNLWHPKMNWSGSHPTSINLMHLSEILCEYFNVRSMGGGRVRTPKQLHRKLIDIVNKTPDKELIRSEYLFWKKNEPDFTIDDAIQAVFNFKRNLAHYNLPKIIYAISAIQEVIFNRFNYSFGDYTAFAFNLENYFEYASLVTLEEFGVPLQISKKFSSEINITESDDLDSVISKLLDTKNFARICKNLSNFESGIVKKAIEYL
jgi:hypothetical protein